MRAQEIDGALRAVAEEHIGERVALRWRGRRSERATTAEPEGAVAGVIAEACLTGMVVRTEWGARSYLAYHDLFAEHVLAVGQDPATVAIREAVRRLREEAAMTDPRRRPHAGRVAGIPA